MQGMPLALRDDLAMVSVPRGSTAVIETQRSRVRTGLAIRTAVELCVSAIMEAGDEFLNDPMGTPFIPNWSRVQSAVPDILGQLYDAVELDNA